MPDVFTKEKRSEVMSKIRGYGNEATELAMIKIFKAQGIKGWRRHRPVYGKPDFVFPKLKLAVFVDGCFWHFCPKHSRMPKGNAEYWLNKKKTNQRRDRLVTKTLRARGWRVLRVWEHALAKKRQPVLVRRLEKVFTISSPDKTGDGSGRQPTIKQGIPGK